MPEMNIPKEFEQQLRQALNVPEPDSATLNTLRERFIALGTAQLGSPNVTKSLPVRSVQAKTTRSWFSRSLAWKFALVLLVLVVLFASFSPAVVNALRSLLGYLPGVGTVEQIAEVRILEAPVQVTHGKIPLTVEQAFVTPEKTVVVYQYNVPPLDGMNLEQTEPISPDRPALILPDGSRMEVVLGRRQPAENGIIRYALEFGPLPADVTTVVLHLDRLAGLPPESSPKDWAIPLRFKPGAASEILYPVTEYEPTVTPTADFPTKPSSAAADPATRATPVDGASIQLEQSVELPDGYLLMGSFRWSDPSVRQDALSLGMPIIHDANGLTIEYELAPLDSYPQPDELRRNWAFKIPDKTFAAPLKITFYATLRLATSIPFTFDPGSNPHNEQMYDLNIELPVNGHQVKIVSARYENPAPNNHYFLFTLTSDDDVIGANIVDPANPAMGGGGGGGSTPVTGVPFSSNLFIEGELPQRPLSLQIASLEVLIPGDWVITWSPEK